MREREFRSAASGARGLDTRVLLGKARVWGPALVALAATLWLAGPRAWTVLVQRVSAGAAGGNSPQARLSEVGFVRRPSWLSDAMLVAVMRDLSPLLDGRLGIMDDAGARALETRLAGSPWVARVALRRKFPDRFVADLELRRPVLAVFGPAEGAIALVDADGRCLPATAAEVPRTTVLDPVAEPLRLGEPHPDARVVAAARVAAEWRDAMVPLVPEAPRLVEVDAANLDYRFLADGAWSEVRIGLARAGGGIAWLGYGHPPGSRWPRVPLATKVEVLRSILAVRPGLDGVDGGDLRFANRWRDWLRPRETAADAR